LSDQTLTDFIIAALNAAAARVVRDHDIISLSAEDSAAFAGASQTCRPWPAFA